ncbi:MAG: hypothetical protein ACTSUK_08415 [Promethearchaeota archaeon]
MIIYSSEAIEISIATIAVQKVMNWDISRARRAIEEADQNDSCLLCIASKAKARDYVLDLEENGLIAEQILDCEK